jgi:DNA-cytosine methyltransferase
MIVLSLFDGMSCGQIALQKCGFPVSKYYASEIDKHAIAQTQLNFPNTIQLGDVRSIDPIDLGHVDLLTGGSPCQGFSLAGTKLNFDDPRSVLFFEFERILKGLLEINPNLMFLLENVPMKIESLKVITQRVGIEPVLIDSALVSAQNRKRYYWTNIRYKEIGIFKQKVTDIPQPEDRGLLLRDVLQPEEEIDEKFYLSEGMLNWLSKHSFKRGNPIRKLDGSTKTNTLTATAQSKQNLQTDFVDVGRLVFGRNEEAKRQRRLHNKKGKDYNPFREKEIIGIDTQKSGALCVSQSNENFIVGCDFRYDEGIRTRKNGKSSALAARARNDVSSGASLAVVNERIRRLTPIECMRLQTVPETYKWNCSNTQIYKMLGNGWTVDVIAHILSYIDLKYKKSRIKRRRK